MASVEAQLRVMLAQGALELPRPGGGSTSRRWAALIGWGRHDLALARLAEGHTDAVAILAEADRLPVPAALCGVWAARSGGVGARLHRAHGGLGLGGSVRFCSGAGLVDRALVVAEAPADAVGDPLLVEVALADTRVHRRHGTRRTAAMDDTETQDVDFDDVPVRPDAWLAIPAGTPHGPGSRSAGRGEWLRFGGAARPVCSTGC